MRRSKETDFSIAKARPKAGQRIKGANAAGGQLQQADRQKKGHESKHQAHDLHIVPVPASPQRQSFVLLVLRGRFWPALSQARLSFRACHQKGVRYGPVQPNPTFRDAS